MYPEPDGFSRAAVRPGRASYDATFGEFLLPEDELNGVEEPALAVQDFLESTYEAGAGLAGWNRAALEADYPSGGRLQRAWSRTRTPTESGGGKS